MFNWFSSDKAVSRNERMSSTCYWFIGEIIPSTEWWDKTATEERLQWRWRNINICAVAHIGKKKIYPQWDGYIKIFDLKEDLRHTVSLVTNINVCIEGIWKMKWEIENEVKFYFLVTHKNNLLICQGV